MNTGFRPMAGRRGLIVGTANERSSAWHCARRTSALGARIVYGCMAEKSAASAAPLAAQSNMSLLAFDARKRGALEAMVEAAAVQLDGFDFVLHSTAWAPSVDLRGRHTDSAGEGLLQAMRSSFRSFAQLARLCGPRITRGGALVTMRCRGTDDAVPQHEMTSPLQEAFESIVRYLAVELEPWGLRVHAVSPGPALVRVASKWREGLAVPDEIDNCVAILIGAGAINVNHGTPHANIRMAALQ